MRLLDFQQGDQVLDLRFEGMPILDVEARAFWAAEQDPGLQVRLVSEIGVTGDDPSISRLRIQLPAADEEPDNREYVVVLRLLLAGHSHTMELVRQGQNFLHNAYGFRRAGGYCILSQHDFDIGASDDYVQLPPRLVRRTPARVRLSLRDIPPGLKAHEKARHLVNESPELALAQSAVRWLEHADLVTGPSGAPMVVRQMFPFLPLSGRVWMLQKGLHRVQCSGFRDLFAELLASEGLRVRAVDASVAVPQFKDLVGYGHSLAEVFLASTGGWAIVDPWMAGMVLLDDGGHPRGIDEVRSGVSLTAVHLVSKLDRKLSPDGRSATQTSTFLPGHVDLEQPRFVRGCRQPGYRGYFTSVQVRAVVQRPHAKGPRRTISSGQRGRR